MKMHARAVTIVSLIFVLAQIVVAAPTIRVAPAASVGWVVFDKPNLGLSVKIPGDANGEDQWTIVGTIHDWIIRSESGIYQVSVTELNWLVSLFTTGNADFRKGMLEGLIKSFFKGLETSSGKEIQSQKLVRDYTINDFPAKEYTYSLASKNGGPTASGHSIFCVTATRCYTFSAIWKSKSDPTANFFASIKIK